MFISLVYIVQLHYNARCKKHREITFVFYADRLKACSVSPHRKLPNVTWFISVSRRHGASLRSCVTKAGITLLLLSHQTGIPCPIRRF